MTIKKVIIPAAGLGTRFLPATKAQPKEMLPIVDKPTIQYIVEEAVQSGIEDIIIVSGRGKRAIEDHFDKSYELEETLLKKEKYEILHEIQGISELANIHYIRQKEPLGLGHAIWCARKFIGNDPFGVMLGDDIVKGDTPCLKQLIDVYDQFGSSVVGIQGVPEKEVSKYGIVAPKGDEIAEDVVKIAGLVEKPNVAEAPSNFAIMGRYVLTADIFDILEKTPKGSGGEIQLTDAINSLNGIQQVLAYQFSGTRYDVGDKFGFVKATIDFSLDREDLRDEVVQYLQTLQYQNYKTKA
ncbi:MULTISPECIES: UTP--glucose-1-phosphate uridylyltransferase GalU [Sutcliffiella]|uniref:UTP--glucose-1-phosphate uridylyltransferase n=1 Tax=Sutcliffiella cohnii TaxID=33932 RepID=A0A223KV66_9BACI|nr:MULTISPECIES: UTP--glucose-1-phosphate uridylyltransferase GalU [Sutcliffiella]AST93356.1 UTP--glucose-1-phosphate uridylyltransferase [Sutcliffiella cohnii]MED4019004.1 UTP--glucose-1-phosphate uridylyltransferase GalU [Sutcliffiella cohnii]WBL14517.1 UTP--glucose-1-phosphate uridylyltransferase GalU [Sutcliffiella sp. NC1]